MRRFEYQNSAYGHPWSTSQSADQLSDLGQFMNNFWLMMLPEKHHRVIDNDTGETVWENRSRIAPEPGTVAP